MSPRARYTDTTDSPEATLPEPAPLAPEVPLVQAARATVHTPAEWRAIKNTRASHFNCARQLHGWRLHEHHEGVAMQLAEADYDAAIVEGQKMPCTPHPKAASPHLGKGL